jgi:hypothetical protein
MKSAVPYVALGVSVVLHLLGLFGVGGLSHDSRAAQVMPGSLSASLLVRALVSQPAEAAALQPPADLRKTLPRRVAQPGLPSAVGPLASPGQIYWPAESLEQAAVPVSAPDVSGLGTAIFPADSARLRLFINARGGVDDVQVLGGEDTEGWAPLCRMFLATAFLPARRAGQTVASVQDIEISISDLIRVL